jgi:membrane protease YdiL (CAAX protease family)
VTAPAGLAVAVALLVAVNLLNNRYARHAYVAYQTLVRIPLGTVVLEEVAFRGVVLGLGGSAYGWVWATVLSAALFGMWHALPARDLVRLNPAERARLPDCLRSDPTTWRS